LLQVEGRIYLPPPRNINSAFLKSFLSGKKRMFKTEEVRFVAKVFNFRELTLENLLQEFPRPEEARTFFPDHVPLQKLDRHYALNVLNTIQLGWVDIRTRQALELRKTGTGREEEGIEIADEFRPLFSSQLYPIGRSRFVQKLKRG